MLAFAFLAGAGFGAVIAWAWFERYGRPREIEIKVDKAMLSQLNEALVMAWLDSRGLVWMPKGVDFKPKVPKA
jgi:hypothetical protein